MRAPGGGAASRQLRRVSVAVAALAAWQVLAGPLHIAHGLLPTPWAILGRVASDGLAFYANGALPTLKGAVLGWCAGSALGIGFAVIAKATPSIAGALATFALVAFCIPGLAIGPILTIQYSVETSRAVLAALPIVFITMTATTAGFANVGAAACDVVRVFGGSRFDRLWRLEIPAAVPNVLTALQIAVPFALLGAVLAEFLGADRGLGVILVAAQQRLAFDRAWAVAILLASVATVACNAIDRAARWLVPWLRDRSLDVVATLRLRHGGAAGTVAHGLARAVGQGMAAVACWSAVLRLLAVPAFIGKGPIAILTYLSDPVAGAERRAMLVTDTMVTAGDGAVGLAAGGSLALAAAAVAVLCPPLRRVVIGPALMIQAMPLAAFAPLIVLAFGRGSATVGAVGMLVAFVPVFVAAWAALHRTPAAAIDLAHVCGASRLSRLVRLQMPAALPDVLAALRVAVPVTMAGALVAEWLATGRGAGYGMLLAAATSDYGGVWARIAAVTGVTLGFYGLFGTLERWIVDRCNA